MNRIAFSFDVDWATNESIEYVFDLLIKYEVKSTWFVTHDFPLLTEMRRLPQIVELGIHPNFLQGTTQGKSEDEIIENLLSIVPEAKIIRMHAMYQYGGLLSKIVQKTDIRVDSSIFLPEMENIVGIKHLTPHGLLHRLPIFWADDYELLREMPNWRSVKYSGHRGIQVFLFHPVHIAKNSFSYANYLKQKADPSGEISATEEEGVRTFFISLLQKQKTRTEQFFLSELV